MGLLQCVFCKRRFITSTKSAPHNICSTKFLFTRILSIHKLFQLAWKTFHAYLSYCACYRYSFIRYLNKCFLFCFVFAFLASMGCIRDYCGSDYVGTISSTVTERECQRWDDQAPHQHDFTDPSMYPDASIPDAENFCRNLDDDPNGPWCFTNDPNVRRQTCNVPLCRGILGF